MKIKPDSRLFWFVKDGVEFDLDEPSHLQMFVQQVLTRGHTSDVKALLRTIDIARFRDVFPKIQRFLPLEVRCFWEDFLGGP